MTAQARALGTSPLTTHHSRTHAQSLVMSRLSIHAPRAVAVREEVQPPCRLIEPADRTVRRMGEAVASDGSWLAVSSPTAGDNAGDLGEVLFVEFELTDPTRALRFRSRADDACGSLLRTQRFQSVSGFDHFGTAIAVARIRTASGPSPLLLIGSDNADVDGLAAGNVEVHSRVPTQKTPHAVRTGARTDLTTDGTLWSLEAVLTSTTPQEGSEFGAALAIAVGDPTIVAVGAPRSDVGSAFDAGTVELFRRISPSSETSTPTPLSHGSFGGPRSRVPVERATRSASAPFTGSDQSALHSARHSNIDAARRRQWRATVTIQSPRPQMSGWFGRAIAMNTRWLAIGAPGTNVTTNEVATGNITTVANSAQHFASTLSQDSSIGSTSDQATIGAAGAVFLYQLSNGQPQYVATLFAPTPNRSMWFGSALAIDGDQLVVGAPGAEAACDMSPNSPTRAGCAFLFNLAEDVRSPVQIDPPICESGGGFGQSVSIAPGFVAIGAPGINGTSFDANGVPISIEDAGRLFVYRMPWAGWSGGLEPPVQLGGPSPWPSALFGSACAFLMSGTSTTPFVATGHLYVEEESHAPSPGVTLHKIEVQSP